MNSHLETVWSKAMDENAAKNLESISGVGSTLKYTEHLRQQLPLLFSQYNIQTVLDAPCGDMNWMSVLLKTVPTIKYIGGDIVDSLIKSNQQYSSDNIKIIKIDITKTMFPDADLWICRDCWFHLPDQYIFESINNFLNSNIKYMLTTTHINTGFENTNLNDVDFKLIDLFKPPYNFPAPIHRITDYYGKKLPREMVLFSREQIINWSNLRNDS